MTRLDELRTMRDFIDREIETELGASLAVGRDNPVVAQVADLYGVTVAEIVGGARRHQVARARHAIAWLLHGQGMGYRDIARVLGYADHTNARYACRRVSGNPAVRALVEGLQVAS